jgi:hypothetical protein
MNQPHYLLLIKMKDHNENNKMKVQGGWSFEFGLSSARFLAWSGPIDCLKWKFMESQFFVFIKLNSKDYSVWR